MTDVVAMTLLAIGTVFMLLAAVGIVRLPDVFMRLSASTKAATFGLSATLIGTAVYFGDVGITARVVATILFVFLTAPVAGHMIGRAAYLSKAPLWENTRIDEFRGQYDLESETLHSAPREPRETPPAT